MSLTAAELRAVYTVDEGPLNKSLGGLGGKVSSTLGKVAGAAAGLFAFDQLKNGFFSLTGAASDLGETVNKSNTIFGANAGAIDQWAKGAAQNLGLSRQQALAAAAGFGDMFGQIGFAGDQAANMSKSVVQMAADLGSFNNLDTADVADRMSAAFRGEYDSLQALIPNINAARVEQEAMAATGKKNASELTAQEKAAAVLAIVQKDGARAMGDFAKTSDGAANAAKIATAEWEDQKAAIGQKLLPALTTMIGFVRSTVIPAVGTLAAFIANDVVPALQSMAQWVQRNEGPVKIIAGLITGFLVAALAVWAARSVASAATNTAAWFTTAAASSTSAAAQSKSAAQVVAGWLLMGTRAALQGARIAAVWTAQIVASAVAGAVSFTASAASVVAGWVLMGVQAMIQAARMAAAWLIAMGPVGWVIAAVVGLVALIVANWDTVVAWTKTAWDAAAGAVSAAWEWIKGAVAAGINFIVGLFLNFTGVGLIIKHWDTIKNATGAAWQWIQNLVGSAVTAVGNAIAAAWNWVRTTTVNAWNAVRNAVSTGVSNAVSFVAGLPGRAASAMGSLGSRLFGVASGAMRSMWDAVSTGISNAVDLVRGLPGRAVSAIGNVGSLLYNAGKNLISGFINGIKGAVGGVKDTLGGLTSKLTSWKGPPARDRVLLRGAGRLVIEGFIGGLESRYAAVRSTLQGLTGDLGVAPRIGVRAPAMAGAGAFGGGAQAAQAAGIGTLLHIDDYHEAPSSSAQSTAQALMIEARTRGFGG